MAKNSRQKRPNFLEILETKVVQFWCYTKLIKNRKVVPKLIFFKEIFLRKIPRIFDIENQLWKSDFGTFWRLFLAILQVWRKNQGHFCNQCNRAFNLKFRWHDEKLTLVFGCRELSHVILFMRKIKKCLQSWENSQNDNNFDSKWS